MSPNSKTNQKLQSRIGFHYFSDMDHYTAKDVQTWLPELRSLGASWLVLYAEAERSVPEQFIRELLAADIKPIIHMHMPLEMAPKGDSLRSMLDAYSHWGVNFIIFFDRPNDRSQWSPTGWLQQDLVERFLDRFIPIADQALESGLTPVFPPLQPGGSYWDTAFLRGAFQSLQRRKEQNLLDHLALSAYGWTNGHELDWGAGGPEAWPEAKPYLTPETSQDQRGLHIAEWYSAIQHATTSQPSRVILLQIGLPASPDLPPSVNYKPDAFTKELLSISILLTQDTSLPSAKISGALKPLTADVVCGAFWLLSSDSHKQNDYSWYDLQAKPGPITEAFKSWVASSQPDTAAGHATVRSFSPAQSIIKHYLLLPAYDWGVADWHMEVIRPFVNRHRPAIGFSLEEASHAEQVTVIGGPEIFPEEALALLRQKGCRVERIEGNGISIATKLAER